MELSHVGAEGRDVREWTVVEGPVGEALGFVPTLTCFPRAWRSSPPAWSAGEGLRAVRVESVALSDRFEARVRTDQDENWLLQLLSPGFIAWLTDKPEADFGFEVHEGILRCFSPGHLAGEDAERLRSEAAAVAERIRSEALESEGLGVRELGSGVPERIERAVASVGFASMPADSRAASLPFRRFAARDPRVYLAALGGVVSAFTLLIWLLFEIGVDAIDLIVSIVSWIGPKGTGIALGVFALAGWIAAIPEAIAIAARRYGRVAFAREYARARGFELESPQSFHRRLMRVELPAPAEFVLRGGVADAREGRLVLCRSARRLVSSYYDAVVFEVGGREDGRGSGDGFEIAVDAGHLVVWRSSSADRSAAQLDGLARHAARVLERLESGDLALARPATPAPTPA